MALTRVVVLSCFVFVLMLFPAGSASGDSMSSEITVSALNLDENLPDVAYNSKRDEYFVVWYDRPAAQPWSVKGRRYSASGDYIGEYVIGFRDEPRLDNMQPSVAYDPDEDRYLVVWTCDYSEDGSFFWVYVRFVNWDGSFATTDYPLRIADEDMFFPRVAYGGSTKEFFVTWWTRGEGTFKDAIWVHKIPADTPTTGSAVVTISGPEDRNYPDIAFNQARNEYIIVYQKATASGGDVMGIRLQGNGTVLGTGEFGIAEWPDDEGAPRIAASRVSNRWAVVWHSQVRPADRDAFARLLWIDGSNTLQMSSPVVVQGTTGDNVNPDIAAYPESSTFLITSSEQYTTGYLGIVARPFYASNVLGPIFDIRMGVAGFSQLPSVAGGKTGWMMVWQQDRDAAGTYQDIHGRIFFSEIFSDGFELGNTTRWSSTVP